MRPTCFVQKYHACALHVANLILRKRPTVLRSNDKQSKKVKVAHDLFICMMGMFLTRVF